MGLLTDCIWQTKYDSDTLSLIKEFYEPALNCAVRYDRSTGFFSAPILTLAVQGIEGLSGYLEVKLALPCSPERQPLPVQGIFHEKAGIIEDKAGNRLAFNGSVNETPKGWASNWESFHVFTDWGGTKTYVDDEERGFAKL